MERTIALTPDLEETLFRALEAVHPTPARILGDPVLLGRFLTEALRQLVDAVPSAPPPPLDVLLSRGNTALGERHYIAAYRAFRAGLVEAERLPDPRWIAAFHSAMANTDDALRVRGEGLAEGRALDHRRAALDALIAASEAGGEEAAHLRRLIARDSAHPLVFLSYDSTQRAFVAEVARALASSTRVRMDVLTFRSGRSLNRSIDGALQTATTAAFFLTPRFFRRKYCIKELMAAARSVDASNYPTARLVVIWMDTMDCVPPFLSEHLLIVQEGRGPEAVAADIVRAITPPGP